MAGSPGAPSEPLHLRLPAAVASRTDGCLVIVDSGKNLHGKRANSGVKTIIAIAPDGHIRTYAGPAAVD